MLTLGVAIQRPITFSERFSPSMKTSTRAQQPEVSLLILGQQTFTDVEVVNVAIFLIQELQHHPSTLR